MDHTQEQVSSLATSPLSRPHTPESPWTNSLQAASATVDDLTSALANFSRVPSPDLSALLICCCGRDDCENHQAWLAFKSKLESRLVLSAEVGQALLQRHEAYARRHERSKSAEGVEKQLEQKVRELQSQNTTLEKRLAQALVNSEVIETSNKIVLQELNETRTSLTRLTTQQLRSVGLESRLASITQEKEDIQQERNSADQRVRLAEARIIALRDRCSKMQDQLNALHRDLEEQRSHRLELSEEILQDARAQLKVLYHPPGEQPPIDQDDEVIKMLESLVTTNETLKRDNGELQRLLSESREDTRALQDELDEFRASENRKYSRHLHTSSIHSTIHSAPLSPNHAPSLGFSRFVKRSASAERGLRRDFEPLTPETPLSPDDSPPWKHFIYPKGRTTPSRISIELDQGSQRDSDLMPLERQRSQKPLLLLNRSQSVQTEPWTGAPTTPPPIPALAGESASSYDGKSESSSMTGSQKSAMSALLERATSLLHRLMVSDPLTLTNRLKRQNLTGADVGHLSRTTVSTIVSEATMLRTNFRTLLEDDKIMTMCSRKDLRALFMLLKDAFTEMGELRMTLNDIILDPSIATKVSDMILHPSKIDEGTSSQMGWMAPIAKLFGGAPDDAPTNRPGMSPMKSNSRGRSDTPHLVSQRMIPKLGPALSASATTVNVEFHASGVGRAVTSTYSASESEGSGSSTLDRWATSSTAPTAKSSSSVMGIFAGAPRPVDPQDPWIVIPKPQRKPPSPLATLDEAAASAAVSAKAATIGRSTMRPTHHANRLSRAVDAVIDVESPSVETAPSDFQTTLLQRTLRPRGLSDSSIRTTFVNHDAAQRADEQKEPEVSTGSSVLATFGRKVLALRSVSSSLVGRQVSRPTTPQAPPARTPIETRALPARLAELRNDDDYDEHASSPLSPGRYLPVLSSWSAAFESGLDPQAPYVGSPRQDWLTARELHGRDY